MADNITLIAGSGGDVVRTDDDGTAHWQYVKLAFGADDTQTIVSNTNPLPVGIVDDAAFTPGTTPFGPVGGTYRSVRDLVNDNDGGELAAHMNWGGGLSPVWRPANSGVVMFLE